MNEHLFPGANFVDVGSHVGVYSLVAAKRVGPQGKVAAIEPQSIGISAITISAELNGFSHLQAFQGVAGSASGTMIVDFESFGAVVTNESNGGKNGVTVRCWTLDDFATENHLEPIHLLKLDAGGNEAAVLRGAGRLLHDRQLKAVAMKLYNPEVVQQRFGRLTWDAVSLLHSNKYKTSVVFHGRTLALKSPEDLSRIFYDGSYCHMLLAMPE